jgi:hypothetical protein
MLKEDHMEARRVGADHVELLRRWVLGVLALGLAGTVTELVLLEHYEQPLQLIPLVLAGLAVLTLSTRTIHWRLAAAAGISIFTWWLQRWTLSGDTADILWAGRTQMAITAALTIIACATGAAWRPILPFRRGALFTALVLAIPAISFGLAIAGGWPSDGSTR